MTVAGSIHQQRFRKRRPFAGVTRYELVTNGFGLRRSARLTRAEHVYAFLLERGCQFGELRGLARTFTALEGNKNPAGHPLAAERHDDETVECAFPSAVDGSNVLAGDHCLLSDRLALDQKSHLTDLGAFFDRRNERPLVEEFDLYLAALRLRECNAHLVACNERRCPD